MGSNIQLPMPIILLSLKLSNGSVIKLRRESPYRGRNIKALEKLCLKNLKWSRAVFLTTLTKVISLKKNIAHGFKDVNEIMKHYWGDSLVGACCTSVTMI
jgi:hypothetical protein